LGGIIAQLNELFATDPAQNDVHQRFIGLFQPCNRQSGQPGT
jgi:hypothetical protein